MVLVTTIPPEELTVGEVVILARASWQTERLCTLWKSDG
jgi:hypothetical protein